MQALGYPFVRNMRMVGAGSDGSGRLAWSNATDVSTGWPVAGGGGFASPSVATTLVFANVRPWSLDCATRTAPGSWKFGSPNCRHATSTLPLTGLTETIADWLTTP